MNKSKISIIVPVYNVEKYLSRCMDSLLNQTLKDIEIIMVDDESPDSCPAMCDEYAHQDSRVKVIHKKNEGLGFARNSGLEIATGEYVAFVDSDDFVDLLMYEKLYENAIKFKLDTIFCGYNSINKNGRIISSKIESLNLEIFEAEEAEKVLLGMIGTEPEYKDDVKYEMSVWRALYSKKLIDKHTIAFCSERKIISEDIIFHIDYLQHATKIGIYPESLYYYCYNDFSLSKSYRTDRFKKMISLYHEINFRLSSLFSTEKYFERSIRYFLLMVRFAIFREVAVIKIIGIKKVFNNIKTICIDSSTLHILKDYPYKLLPFKHRIFFKLIRRRNIILIMILSAFINIRK